MSSPAPPLAGPAARLRVALVCDWYPPRVGGIELHVAALAEQLAGAGHAVDVVTTVAGSLAPEGGVPRGPDAGLGAGRRPTVAGRTGPSGPALPGRVRVRRLALPCVHPWALAVHPGLVRALARTLADGAFDVVHCHASVLSPLAFAAAAAADRMGLPCVLTQHSLLGAAAHAWAAADRVIGWSRWRVLQTAVSPLVAEAVRVAAPTLAVAVLPNGIDREAWAVAPRRGTRLPGEVRVVSVMRLAARKRPVALVRAVARARAALPPGVRLRVRVAGDGPSRGAVERAVRRLGLDDVVELLGWQSHPAVRRLYAESDVFVLPSLQESFGIAALEARCAGLPVVAMRRAGPSGFVRHEVEGLLADDDAGLAAQLVRLATDDRLRAAIARHNRTTRPAETWDVVLRRHEVVYAEAARLAAAPRPRRRPRPGGTSPLPPPLAALAALAPWTGDAEIGRTDERRGGPRRPRR